MRALVVSVNHRFFNDMHVNFYHSLSEIMDVDYYGPGYVEDWVLNRGVKLYLREKGDYDVIIVTYNFIILSIEDFTPYEIYREERLMVMDYFIPQAIRTVPSVLRDLKEMDGVRILLFNGDMGTMTSEMNDAVRKLLQSGFYLCAAGAEFAPDIDAMVHQSGGVKWTEHYTNIVNEYRERVISISCVATGLTEYCFSPLSSRKYDWCVPGSLDVHYPLRNELMEKLQKTSYKIFDNYTNRMLGYKKNRKYKSIYSKSSFSESEIAAWRMEYHISLCNSKICFTDGGYSRSIVRKFFEIPSRGALLACESPVGFREMGFIDGVNMVEVTPENAVEKSAELFADPIKMQEIAHNGQRLVIKNHTFQKRAACVKDAVESILAGRFRGSCWKNGAFIINEV